VRIGIDARLNAYRDGGIAEYTRRFTHALSLLDSANEYVVLNHARNPRAVAPSAPNFRAVRTITPPHHKLERWTLGLEAARFRLDLLHSPDFIPPHRIPGTARRTVITIHDLNFVHYPQFQTPDSLRYYNGNLSDAVRRADAILADSQATKDDLVKLLNAPPDKITVHMLGVDHSAFRPMPSEATNAARMRLKLPSAYILFVGTFEPRKNLPGLLEAYHVLRERMPDAPPLVIVGRRGWLYEPIFKRAAELNLSDCLLWLEDAATSDLPAIYNGASVLVLPSFYEGFGFPALEAMACGIPTVVSDRGSLIEVVGDTGILIDPDQPETLIGGLHTALTDSAFREKSRAAGIARAAGFTWENTAQIVFSTYLHGL
jgi:glycosyltransferase involved in cell wall biosynthesis